ncbi:TPA: hypothetical protein U2Q33_000789 [Citrobacter farmeri]|nr:hypothetical protein [Citrobacter farmeri]
MHNPNRPFPVPKHKGKTLILLGITHRLQTMMINENITPEELVSCAQAVKLSYDSVQAATKKTSTTWSD